MAGFDESRPIFLQLAEMLEDGIISGAFPEEGLVYKKRGVGMFVASGAREKLLQKRRDSFYVNLALPTAKEARALGLSLEELQKMMERGYNDGD